MLLDHVWTPGRSEGSAAEAGRSICEDEGEEEGSPPPQVACGKGCKKPRLVAPVGDCRGVCNIKGPNGEHDGPHTCGTCEYSWS